MVTETPRRQFHEKNFCTFKPKPKKERISSTPIKKRLDPEESFVEAMIAQQFNIFNHGSYQYFHVKAELPGGELEVVDNGKTYYIHSSQNLLCL